MDTSATGPLVAGPSTGPGASVPGIPSGPGWIALRDCPLGGNGPPVGLALLHPKIGVALVDFAQTPLDAADRFRRALDDRRFPAIFGGHPPIVRAVLPAERLPDLGQVLAEGFRAEPPFALSGGDAWVPTARAALEQAAAAPAPQPPGRPGRRDVSPWRAAVLVLGAAASGAAAAAVAVMPPPWLGFGGAPDSAAVPVAAPVVPAARAPTPAPIEPPAWPAPEEVAVVPAARAPTSAPVAPPAWPAPEEGNAAAPPEADGASAGSDDAPTPQEAGGYREPAPPLPTPDENGSVPAATPVPLAAAGAAGAAGAAAGGGASAGDDLPRPAPRPAAERPAAERPAAERQRKERSAAGSAASAALPADAAGRKRCHDILVKASLGEDLSDGDKQLMLRRCRAPRD